MKGSATIFTTHFALSSWLGDIGALRWSYLCISYTVCLFLGCRCDTGEYISKKMVEVNKPRPSEALSVFFSHLPTIHCKGGQNLLSETSALHPTSVYWFFK